MELNQQFGQSQQGVTMVLPGTEAPKCSIKMDDFVVNADGINGFFWFNVEKNAQAYINPVFWPVDDKSPIPVTVTIPKGYYHPQDQSIRFVHWGPYDILYPKYSLTIDGYNYGQPHWKPLKKTPKIHKTDIDVRCKMVAFHSEREEVRYFDELPFPEDQLLQNRHLVCDYCFFGGPDKNEPKPNN
ncbi:hypothetical protein HMI54_013410 [Coelomomyces lativittatus]|nr:hypothetical protein HMI54_013410 [Coelomomyces lativittatus]